MIGILMITSRVSYVRRYIQKTVGASAVRVSRQELRPLSAKDVDELRASRSGEGSRPSTVGGRGGEN